MNSTTYAAELRRAANMLENLDVVPILDELPTWHLRERDFMRTFAGRTVSREEANGKEHLRGIIDDIVFVTCRDIPECQPVTVTLPKEAA